MALHATLRFGAGGPGDAGGGADRLFGLSLCAGAGGLDLGLHIACPGYRTVGYVEREAMAWCEEKGVDYIFGLAGNKVLDALAGEIADDLKVRRAEAGAEKMRTFAAFTYAAVSWKCDRRVVVHRTRSINPQRLP